MYSRVSIKAAQALHRGQSYQSANTRVADGVMWVNGTKVAWYDAGDTELRITFGLGQPPAVIIDRLEAVLAVFGLPCHFQRAAHGAYHLLSRNLAYMEAALLPGAAAAFNIKSGVFVGYRSIKE